MGDDRPSTYVEDDVVIYRASSVGNCVRGLVASRLGYEPMPHPDWLLDKFEEGNRNEPVILKMLEDTTDWRMVEDYGQLEVVVPVGSKVKIRGHLDGIGRHVINDMPLKSLSEERVVEAKAFGPDFWKKYDAEGILAFPYYSSQLTIYMYATGLKALFVVGRKNADGEVTEIRTTLFEEPPIGIETIKMRVAKAERWVAEGVLPPCDPVQYPCQFYYVHEDEAKPVAVEDLELDLLASQYVAGRTQEKKGRDIKGPAGESLLKLMDARGVGEVHTATYDAVVVNQQKVKVDMDGIRKKLGPEGMFEFEEGYASRYVKVTERKK